MVKIPKPYCYKCTSCGELIPPYVQINAVVVGGVRPIFVRPRHCPQCGGGLQRHIKKVKPNEQRRKK